MKQKGIIGIVCLLFAMLLLSMQTVQAVSQDRNTEKLLYNSNVEVVSQTKGYQTTTLDIPDLEFRKWIWNNVLNRREDVNGGVETTGYTIYESDLDAIQSTRWLDIFGINDLTGIHYFENLLTLTVGSMTTDILDIALPELHELRIFDVKAKNIKLVAPNLLDLNIYDIDGISKLELDLPNLLHFNISYTSLQEIELNTPRLFHLGLDQNDFVDLTIDSDSIKYLYASNNKLKNLNLKMDNLQTLFVNSNQLTSIDLNLPSLDYLNISDNQISTINLDTPKLLSLYMSNNKIGGIDLSGKTELKLFVPYQQHIDNVKVQQLYNESYRVDFNQIPGVDPFKIYNVIGADFYNRTTGIAEYSILPDVIQYTYNVGNPNVNDMNVTASYSIIKEHKVLFLDGFNGETIKTEFVYTGQAATAPTPPEVEGYRFIGWDEDYSNVVEDIVVTALYEEVELPTPTYTIVFETVGGAPLPPQQLELGSRFVLDMVPTREGYQFVGWYLDEQYEMSVSEIVVSEDLTIYAKWEEIEAPLPPVVEPDEEDKPLPPVVEPDEEDKPLPPVVEPEEEDKPLPPVVEPEEEDKQLPPVVEPEEEDKLLPPVVAPEEEGSTSPEMKPESPQGDENPTEKPPGTGTQSQLAWMMLLMVVSLFGFFLVKQNRV